MRDDQWATYLSIDGTPVPGPGITWDTTSGGEVDSEETKYAPGGMQSQRALGGRRTVGNITVTKMLDQTTGDWDTLRQFQSRAGRATCAVTRQPLDADGNPFGTPLVYTGILKTITPPEANSEASGAAMWTVVQSTSDVA